MREYEPRGLPPRFDKIITGNTRAAVADKLRELTREQEIVSGSDWADRYRIMPSSSAYHRWRTDRTPYLREILNCMADTDPAHQVIVVQKATQMGLSECLLNECLRRVHQTEGGAGILYYMETQDKANAWSSERLDPALAQTPFTGMPIHAVKNRRAFPGGFLIFSGSGSPTALSSTTAAIVAGDEVARYPLNIGGNARGEGDFLSLAQKRTETFGTRGKIFLFSTPIEKIHGEGTFPDYYARGDAREYLCPCPECGGFFLWALEHLRQLETGVCMVCPECGGITNDGEQRIDCVLNGKWEPTQEPGEPDTVSFRASAFIAPPEWKPWEKILRNSNAAHAGKVSLQTFYNTVLALPWSEPTARVPAQDEVIRKVRGEYHEGFVPEQAAFLTIAIDVQKDYLDYEVRAWGEELENWGIVREQINLVIDDTPAVVSAIRRLFARKFPHPSGGTMTPWCAAIDSGYKASAVYRVFDAFPTADRRGKYFAVPFGALITTKGADMRLTPNLIMGEPGGRKSRGRRRHLKFWRIGTDCAKRELYHAIRSDVEAAVFARPHAPVEYPDDYYAELTAEQIITRPNKYNGKPEQGFECPPRTANEALDLWVMSRVLAELVGSTEWSTEDWARTRAFGLRAGEPKKAAAKNTAAARQARRERQRAERANRRRNR